MNKGIKEKTDSNNISWLNINSLKLGVNYETGSICLLIKLNEEGSEFGIKIDAADRQEFVNGAIEANNEILRKAN